MHAIKGKSVFKLTAPYSTSEPLPTPVSPSFPLPVDLSLPLCPPVFPYQWTSPCPSPSIKLLTFGSTTPSQSSVPNVLPLHLVLPLLCTVKTHWKVDFPLSIFHPNQVYFPGQIKMPFSTQSPLHNLTTLGKISQTNQNSLIHTQLLHNIIQLLSQCHILTPARLEQPSPTPEVRDNVNSPEAVPTESQIKELKTLWQLPKLTFLLNWLRLFLKKRSWRTEMSMGAAVARP